MKSIYNQNQNYSSNPGCHAIDKNIDKRFGFVFAAVCLTGIGYFIFFKGLGGTPYAAQIKDVLNQSLSTVLAVMFGFWLLISLLIDKVFKKDVLVLVVGVGTFGLALSFSGNDLVNFIGVPMAAYHSYEAWSVSGISPGDFSMSVLNKQVPAEPLFLFIAGGVMVTTLWFSFFFQAEDGIRDF